MPRRQPYTDRGIARVPCAKCGKPSRFQWRICAEGYWYGLCPTHDVELNELAGRWAFGRKAEPKLKAYRRKVLG